MKSPDLAEARRVVAGCLAPDLDADSRRFLLRHIPSQVDSQQGVLVAVIFIERVLLLLTDAGDFEIALLNTEAVSRRAADRLS